MGRELGAEDMTRTGKGEDRRAPAKIETHGGGSARMVLVRGGQVLMGESGVGLERVYFTAGARTAVLVRQSRGLRGERASETNGRTRGVAGRAPHPHGDYHGDEPVGGVGRHGAEDNRGILPHAGPGAGPGRGDAGRGSQNSAHEGHVHSKDWAVFIDSEDDHPLEFPAGQEPRETGDEPPQIQGKGCCATKSSGRGAPMGSMLIGLLGVTALRRRGR